MGEVYKATDTRLGRTVAIKVLPSHLSGNAELQERFEREARAVSSLNHPHICTLYDVGHQDGVEFLVMEYLEGETLAQRLEKGALALDEALELGGQIAEALDQAHRAGLVHRDLKPGNIMLSPQGAKLLDFGLAKLHSVTPPTMEGSETPTNRRSLTASNVVMGTFPYAAPEQLEGKPVDSRADIFALGAVLYETVTGRRAFPGDSTASIIAAILKQEPEPIAQLEPSTPPALERVIRRCLAKNPEERWRSASELKDELRAIHTRDSTNAEDTSRERGRVIRIAWPSLIGAIVLALGSSAYLIYRWIDRPAVVPRLTSPVQLTYATGVEDHPSWSPDGRTLAYDAQQTGTWDVWLVPVGSTQPVNRTVDEPGDSYYPTWSPDGTQIAFFSSRDGGGIFVMPALAGVARKVSNTWDWGGPQWSPDGAELAYLVWDDDDTFAEILTLGSGAMRRVPLPGDNAGRFQLAWSPDKRFLAYVDAEAFVSQASRLWILRMADEQAFPVTDGSTGAWSPSWSSNGRSLHFVSNQGGSRDLWLQPLDREGRLQGAAVALTTGIEIRSASMSRDGTRLAYSKGRRVSNVWRVPILRDRPASWADAKQLTFDQAYIEFIDVSRDGNRLLMSSDRSGNEDIWICGTDRCDLQQLTNDPAHDMAPMWSPDAREILFYSTRSGNRDLWVMPADGGPPRQLTRDPTQEHVPVWSPDGKEIAFISSRTGSLNLWVMPSDGGEGRSLASQATDHYMPHWSPDGAWVASDADDGGTRHIWRVRASGGEHERLTETPGRIPRWSPDGARIYFRDDEERRTLREVLVRDRTERLLAEFNGRPGRLGDFTLATDGRFLFFTWEEDLGDIWVMEVSGSPE
jgi:Tol biopolymer transport system component